MLNMNKSKQAIVLLHGALGTSGDLAPIAQYLNEKGHETYSFNFSGHGQNAAEPGEFRIDLFAKDLDQFLKKHELVSPIVFGYSIGGYVALYHKANFEDSPIQKIFTYGTKFNWSEKSVIKELPMLNPEHLQEKYPNSIVMLKEKHGERWKQILLSTAHLMQHLEKLDGLTKEDMSEIDIPVYLILGDQDRMVTTEETHLAQSWLHHSQVRTLSHSKHELERSNLRELTNIILDYLD